MRGEERTADEAEVKPTRITSVVVYPRAVKVKMSNYAEKRRPAATQETSPNPSK